MPYYPQLPWLSVPEAEFPPRASQKKRRRRAPVPAQEEGLALPSREQTVEPEVVKEEETQAEETVLTPTEDPVDSRASTIAAVSEAEVETPSTSHPPSEADSTNPITPSSAMPLRSARPAAPSHSHVRTATKPAVPLIPIRPIKPASVTSTTQKSVKSAAADKDKDETKKAEDAAAHTPAAETPGSAEETPKASPPPKAAPPKSWAELLRSKVAPTPAQAPIANGVVTANGSAAQKSNSLGDVLAAYSVDSDKKLSFLEPRGLVNTGNMCYMNSVSRSPD